MKMDVSHSSIPMGSLSVDLNFDKVAPVAPKSSWLIRLFDIVISLTALLFLAPALLIVAFLVKMHDGGPVLYGQRRIGFDGREFKCFKFRSMHIDSDAMLQKLLNSSAEAREEWRLDHKLRNDPRVTRIGQFLRKSSLDELPQLINIIKGEMSVVGPRPIVQAEICKYGRSFTSYASVRPGLTGLWQVMGRNDVTYQRRVALDRTFAKNYSLTLYFKILVLTIPAVLAQRGSY